MSEIKHETEPVDILNALTEAQLQEILTSELSSDKTNVELIKRANFALNAKKVIHEKYDINDKWREFVSEYVGTEPLYDIHEEPVVSRTSKPTVAKKLHPNNRCRSRRK